MADQASKSRKEFSPIQFEENIIRKIEQAHAITMVMTEHQGIDKHVTHIFVALLDLLGCAKKEAYLYVESEEMSDG